MADTEVRDASPGPVPHGSGAAARSGRPADRVVLIGPMGAGKTTVGTALAGRLGWSLRDCDAELVASAGRPARAIAASDGIPRLHELEAEVLLRSLDGQRPDVVTAAASTVDTAVCRQALRQVPLVVWLDARTEQVLSRLANPSHRRPLEPGTAAALLERRRVRYREVSHLRVDGDRAVEDLVGELLGVVTNPPPDS